MKNTLQILIFICLFFVGISESKAKSRHTTATDSCIDIVFTNGQILSAKIKNVSNDSISYIACSGNASLKTIDKRRVKKINISQERVNYRPNQYTETLVTVYSILASLVFVLLLIGLLLLLSF